MPAERALLNAYLKKQVVVDAEINRVLRATIRSLSAEITRLSTISGPGAALRATQLGLTRDIMQGWAKIGTVIERNVIASAADIAKVQQAFDSVLFAKHGAGISEDYARSLLQTARSGMDSYISRAHNGLDLSERVYKNGRKGVKTVESLINQGLLSGKSAREIAASVKRYISPTTPGGMSYAAQRLGRTELNNAFHATSIRLAVEDPFVESLQWHLSGSHPRADECDAIAGNVGFRGGDAGQYRPGDVPSKPHPQCLCYTSPVTISDEEFLRRLRRGDLDHMADLVA
jgi:hypothetical protein